MMSWLSRSRLPFNKEYRGYAVTTMPGQERHGVDSGGKVILPPSALEHLTRLNTAYPMLFKLTNARQSRETHCGVLEFIADEGRCYIPTWMMRSLSLEEGQIVRVQSVSLPVASFSKFQPLTSAFLDISNPKAVLESALRNFACLTTGELIVIHYNDRNYELRVLETQPGPAVSIIECDMDVDFAPPVDYIEPQTNSKLSFQDANEHSQNFSPFTGSGNRLDGKLAEIPQSSNHGQAHSRGIPDYSYEPGHIVFNRHLPPKPDSSAKKDNSDFQAFTGQGQSLNPARKRRVTQEGTTSSNPAGGVAIPLPPPSLLSAEPEFMDEFDPEGLGSNAPPPSQLNTPFIEEDDLNMFFDYETPLNTDRSPTPRNSRSTDDVDMLD